MIEKLKLGVFAVLFGGAILFGLTKCQRSELNKAYDLEKGECRNIMQLGARRLGNNFTIDCYSESLSCRACRKED